MARQTELEAQKMMKRTREGLNQQTWPYVDNVMAQHFTLEHDRHTAGTNAILE